MKKGILIISIVIIVIVVVLYAIGKFSPPKKQQVEGEQKEFVAADSLVDSQFQEETQEQEKVGSQNNLLTGIRIFRKRDTDSLIFLATKHWAEKVKMDSSETDSSKKEKWTKQALKIGAKITVGVAGGVEKGASTIKQAAQKVVEDKEKK